MQSISLTKELLTDFLKWGGHIVFVDRCGVSKFRGDVATFNIQEGKLLVILTGVESNREGTNPTDLRTLS